MFCMFCAYTRTRYQVGVYRTIGPLVLCCLILAGNEDLHESLDELNLSQLRLLNGELAASSVQI